MTFKLRTYWVLTTATLGIYLVMVLWSLPYIADQAGGERAFDLRPLGYSFDEAQIFLDALTENGRLTYLNIQHQLDRVYPALLAVWLIVTIRALTPRWSPLVHLSVSVMAVCAALFDYMENIRVEALLLADEVSAAAVASASQATVAKSVLGGALLSLTAILLLRRAWQRIWVGAA